MAPQLPMRLFKLSCQRKSLQGIYLLRNWTLRVTLSHTMRYTFLQVRRYQLWVLRHVSVGDFVHIMVPLELLDLAINFITVFILTCKLAVDVRQVVERATTYFKTIAQYRVTS